MRITRLDIKDFRAFKGEYSFDLKPAGNNLLVYGENGSGKSSLAQALNLALDAQYKPRFVDHKNVFVTTNDGHVKLQVGDGVNPANDRTYEWSEAANPFSEALVIEDKGCS
jgi:predicted ATP-dependent endonuclease of OLD family